MKLRDIMIAEGDGDYVAAVDAAVTRNGEWIEWKGGPQPLPDNTLIYWKLWQNGRNVECGPGYPEGLVWTHGPDGPRFNDIVAYRVSPQEHPNG